MTLPFPPLVCALVIAIVASVLHMVVNAVVYRSHLRPLARLVLTGVALWVIWYSATFAVVWVLTPRPAVPMQAEKENSDG